MSRALPACIGNPRRAQTGGEIAGEGRMGQGGGRNGERVAAGGVDLAVRVCTGSSRLPAPFLSSDLQQQDHLCGFKETHYRMGSLRRGKRVLRPLSPPKPSLLLLPLLDMVHISLTPSPPHSWLSFPETKYGDARVGDGAYPTS